MRHSSYYYHAEADHARRLADMTIQPNVKQVLRRVAEELDHLADEISAGEVDLRWTPIARQPEPRLKV